ncbi:MAG: FixG Ig-like domain-containing protein, partial [Planctomycetota bacterium]
ATLTIQNRTVSEVAYSASFMNFGGAAVESDDLPLNVGPGESTRIPVLLRISRDAFENGRFVAKISIDGDDGSSAEVKFQMFGPARSTP